ncbi:DUF1573 domain-containing protein [Pseudotenacibaculum sp. MALMAid0570]|uniref:DUF2059 domain-containing protein n=1 Tax=Pseudotenacibaculum sp. MALMAid0570 TaxID=3143938 RepID=UPI0032DE40E6
MFKKILLAVFLLAFFQIEAQTIDEKIEELLIVDGTVNDIEKLLRETINYQKQSHNEITDNFWENLEEKVKNKSLPEFISIMKPMYLEIYSESEIDNLLAFFKSNTGEKLVNSKHKLIEKLTLPITQWTQNVNSHIIQQIENLSKGTSSSDEIESFKTQFMEKHGLQILNFEDLSIDQEHNVGTILLDFGKTDGKTDVTKIITVKNNSGKELLFEKPFFPNEVINFDWGNTPIKPKEIRKLKFTLNSKKAEHESYSSLHLRTNTKRNITVGVKYNAPRKKISFEVSKKKLKFKKLKLNFSKPYVFKIKNTGEKDFFISGIKINHPIVYLNYSKESIESNEESEIRVIFSKDLIKNQDLKEVKLKLSVDLVKGNSNNHFNTFADETIELMIE